MRCLKRSILLHPQTLLTIWIRCYAYPRKREFTQTITFLRKFRKYICDLLSIQRKLANAHWLHNLLWKVQRLQVRSRLFWSFSMGRSLSKKSRRLMQPKLKKSGGLITDRNLLWHCPNLSRLRRLVTTSHTVGLVTFLPNLKMAYLTDSHVFGIPLTEPLFVY